VWFKFAFPLLLEMVSIFWCVFWLFEFWEAPLKGKKKAGKQRKCIHNINNWHHRQKTNIWKNIINWLNIWKKNIQNSIHEYKRDRNRKPIAISLLIVYILQILIKDCFTSLIIREIQIKTILWTHIFYLSNRKEGGCTECWRVGEGKSFQGL
jgi:hypothetical protein